MTVSRKQRGGVAAIEPRLVDSAADRPIRQGDDLKIVWRMTGEGDLAVSYATPDDQPRELVFGPEPHDGSTYSRPGDEWGTGFRFDQPGCWHIHLQRTRGAGDVWLTVAA